MQQQWPDILKSSHVGAWCQWGAIIVAILGILQIIILATQNQLLPVLSVLSATIFSTLILYAVGALAKHTLGHP